MVLQDKLISRRVVKERRKRRGKKVSVGEPAGGS